MKTTNKVKLVGYAVKLVTETWSSGRYAKLCFDLLMPDRWWGGDGRVEVGARVEFMTSSKSPDEWWNEKYSLPSCDTDSVDKMMEAVCLVRAFKTAEVIDLRTGQTGKPWKEDMLGCLGRLKKREVERYVYDARDGQYVPIVNVKGPEWIRWIGCPDEEGRYGYVHVWAQNEDDARVEVLREVMATKHADPEKILERIRKWKEGGSKVEMAFNGNEAPDVRPLEEIVRPYFKPAGVLEEVAS